MPLLFIIELAVGVIYMPFLVGVCRTPYFRFEIGFLSRLLFAEPPFVLAVINLKGNTFFTSLPVHVLAIMFTVGVMILAGIFIKHGRSADIK